MNLSNIDLYFREESDSEQCFDSLSPVEDKHKSNILIIDIVDVQVDPNETKYIIKIGKCLDENECKKLTNILLETPNIFSWVYSKLSLIYPNIISHNIVIAPKAKIVNK